jgi:hypothetical protein
VRIDAAASYFEEQTGRQLLTATREAWLDAFPFAGASGTAARIELPHPPLQKVLDVTYIDSTGVRRSFTDGASPATPHYTWSAPVGPYARRGVVEPLAGQVWPTVTAQTGAVRITYRCGYGDTADAVPALARGILCYLVGHFDTFLAAVHQGQVVELPYGVCELMDGFKYSAYPQQLLRPLAWPVPGMPPA